jgi:hypothetical protein
MGGAGCPQQTSSKVGNGRCLRPYRAAGECSACSQPWHRDGPARVGSRIVSAGTSRGKGATQRHFVFSRGSLLTIDCYRPHQLRCSTLQYPQLSNTTPPHFHSIVLRHGNALTCRRKFFLQTMKHRAPDPSEICALDFEEEFRRSAICSVSATIGIDWPIFHIACKERPEDLRGKYRQRRSQPSYGFLL